MRVLLLFRQILIVYTSLSLKVLKAQKLPQTVNLNAQEALQSPVPNFSRLDGSLAGRYFS